MLLKQIKLYNFRNFEKADFIFNPFLTVIIGDNARGKTNLLESIYFLVNGVGFRESKEEELINFKKEKGNVDGLFVEKDNKTEFKINLSKVDGRTEKIYFLNKTKKRHLQYLKDQTKAILFSPEQIQIITDSPDVRRDYFNKIISFYDYEYKKRLGNYENSLRRRNKILEAYHDEDRLKEELVFWDDYLEKQAVYIIEKRQQYINYLNTNPNLDDKEFKIEYIKNELNKERFCQVFDLEKRIKRTMIGPQKDDFHIFMSEKNIHHFGSRSEQRLAIIWLKINEIKYYEEKFNRMPILLLDDILSELDSKNKKMILDLVKKYQTVLTTTEKEIIDLIEVEKTILNVPLSGDVLR